MPAQKPDWSKLRVLVLEDEPLLLLDVQDLLKDLGVQIVVACASLPAAARSAASVKFNIAILDLVLAGKSAVPLALELHRDGVSIGFVSGADADAVPPALRSRPLLRKPYTPDAFAAFLQRLVP